MKNLILFSLFSFIVLLSSCQKDQSVTIDFTASYGDESFELLKDYTLVNGKSINFLRSDIFLSDITLVTKNDIEIPLEDIFLVEFNNDELTNNSLGTIPINESIDDLKTLKFGLGVSADHNALNPEEFPADSPLRTGGYYWDAWNSFIFSKTEGKLDEDGDGEKEIAYVFHTGSDEVYQTVELDLSASANSDENSRLITVNFDHKNMLNPGGVAMDIAANPIIHNSGGLEILKAFMITIKESLSVKQ